MDKLKDFIDANKEAFNDDMLPQGHFERFERKLITSSGRRFKRKQLYMIGAFIAAACFALLFILRIPGGSTIPNPVKQQTAQHCQKQEIEELRIYYNMQMNDVMARMEEIYKEDKTPGTSELLQATKQVLRDNYMFEQTILPTLPCSNNGLYAMTQHYNSSLEGLSIMLKQMEQVAGSK
ncbi:hypothetical protein [Parabacteroides chinchillae]|uniref:Uncharacterized protein n=1 Tax=Parabacteroides chinchillae TaxID=871327 RepID=A0A8G2FAW6_9BACT|nr:hypothetical protein [Parabacteroides chinchillae]SEF89648.1 hypothetical protein SAMN05444001_10928 [Parabacteroides chinchillae]